MLWSHIFRQWELENGEGQSTASMNHVAGHETALLAAMVSLLFIQRRHY
jgi:hypothetical protein